MDEQNLLDICAYWYLRKMTGAEYLAEMRKFFTLLRNRFVEFSEIHVVTDSGTSPINSDFSNFDEQTIKWLPDDWAYNNPNDPTNKAFSLESTPGIAFFSSYTNDENPGPGTSPNPVIHISATMGRSDDKVNNVIISLTKANENYDFVNSLFAETIRFWSPHHALVKRQSYSESLQQPAGDIRVGWLTYIKSAEVAPFVPAQCTAESFHEGTLIRALPQVPSRSGEEIIPTLLEIRDALNARGILANPRKRLKPT